MFGDEKNLKDSANNSSNQDMHKKDKGVSISYTKTDKLVMALYMVTDIIDRDEPIRNKLRTLGAGIISDINLIKQNKDEYMMSVMQGKIAETMSFLDIASAVNIISEMNCNILRKEFMELSQSLRESSNRLEMANKPVNLSDFFSHELPNSYSTSSLMEGRVNASPATRNFTSGSSSKYNSVGVQKGDTLMQALNKLGGAKNANTSIMSDRKSSQTSSSDAFELLKKQRSDSLVLVIKTIEGGATIKDIKDKIKIVLGKGNPLMSFSEKTLQRELISMVKTGVLYKTGEKRWSRYFLK